MKTKFSQLVKLKKRKVDEIENELLDVQNQKRRVLVQIEDILKEFKVEATKENRTESERDIMARLIRKTPETLLF